MTPIVYEEKPTFPQYLCQVSVQSEQEKMIAKLMQKEEKREKKEARKMQLKEEQEPEFNVSQARARMYVTFPISTTELRLTNVYELQHRESLLFNSETEPYFYSQQ